MTETASTQTTACPYTLGEILLCEGEWSTTRVIFDSMQGNRALVSPEHNPEDGFYTKLSNLKKVEAVAAPSISQTTKPAIKHICIERGMLYRLEREGRPVALATALSNGQWALCDLNDVRLSRISFPTPKACAQAAERRNLGA